MFSNDLADSVLKDFFKGGKTVFNNVFYESSMSKTLSFQHVLNTIIFFSYYLFFFFFSYGASEIWWYLTQGFPEATFQVLKSQMG